ncbi:glycosyltransferase family 4 protein [Candidatus Gottesmanbacteria bacterium]|nr:glycosyltransferase family 4 protein [Candidatus Gottesmanbacteria bacterium]
MKKLNIALINPPVAGHKLRGTGTYGEELFRALKKMRRIQVSQVNYGSSLDEFDVAHYPYFDPFFLTLPVIKPKPTIVTVHDLIPLRFPGQFPRGVKGEIKWFIQRFSLQSAKIVLTDSVASKNDIAEFTDIDKERIKVIYLGVRSEFRVIKQGNVLEKIKKKYQLPEKFLLHVGDVNYNKNIPGIIKAFAKLSKKYSDLHLVLVGNGFREDSLQLHQLIGLISEDDLSNKVRRLGFIELSDLTGVYNLAQVYLQPSYAEGFGLPVLEAMICGCPVISSHTSSLPELVGEASLLIDPYNEEDMTNSIEKVLKNKKRRQDMIEAGFKRAKEFSWEKCAEKTLEVYQSLFNTT